jgi:hypothetical protein
MFFMGSCKVSSFDCHWVGRHPTTPIVMYTGIVYEPLTDSPECGITWKMCTRVRWAWLDSLIVIMNCGCSWCLHEPRVVKFYPCKVYIDSNIRDTLRYGWGLIIVSKHSNETSLCLLWELWGWQWILCSRGLIIINCWMSYLCMFSIGCKPICVNQPNLPNNMLKSI